MRTERKGTMDTKNKPMMDAKDIEGKNPDEILALAKDMGMELSDAELEGVAGGSIWDPPNAYSDGCPNCGSHNLQYGNVGQTMWYTCKDCGKTWC